MKTMVRFRKRDLTGCHHIAQSPRQNNPQRRSLGKKITTTHRHKVPKPRSVQSFRGKRHLWGTHSQSLHLNSLLCLLWSDGRVATTAGLCVAPLPMHALVWVKQARKEGQKREGARVRGVEELQECTPGTRIRAGEYVRSCESLQQTGLARLVVDGTHVASFFCCTCTLN